MSVRTERDLTFLWHLNRAGVLDDERIASLGLWADPRYRRRRLRFLEQDGAVQSELFRVANPPKVLEPLFCSDRGKKADCRALANVLRRRHEQARSTFSVRRLFWLTSAACSMLTGHAVNRTPEHPSHDLACGAVYCAHVARGSDRVTDWCPEELFPQTESEARFDVRLISPGNDHAYRLIEVGGAYPESRLAECSITASVPWELW